MLLSGQTDFFGTLHDMLKERPDIAELHAVQDAHVPVMKFKLKGISVDLLYAKLNLWQIPEVRNAFPCVCVMWHGTCLLVTPHFFIFVQCAVSMAK
jgi:hypothetical protein